MLHVARRLSRNNLNGICPFDLWCIMKMMNYINDLNIESSFCSLVGHITLLTYCWISSMYKAIWILNIYLLVTFSLSVGVWGFVSPASSSSHAYLRCSAALRGQSSHQLGSWGHKIAQEMSSQRGPCRVPLRGDARWPVVGRGSESHQSWVGESLNTRVGPWAALDIWVRWGGWGCSGTRAQPVCSRNGKPCLKNIKIIWAKQLEAVPNYQPCLGNPHVLLAESGSDSREKEQFGRFGVGFRLQVTFCPFLLLSGEGGRK